MVVKSSDRGTVSNRFRRLSSNIYFVYITVITAFREHILNVYDRFFSQIYPQNLTRNKESWFAIGTRNCSSCMFVSKSCYLRVAIDAAAAADISPFLDLRFRVLTLRRSLTNGNMHAFSFIFTF